MDEFVSGLDAPLMLGATDAGMHDPVVGHDQKEDTVEHEGGNDFQGFGNRQ